VSQDNYGNYIVDLRHPEGDVSLFYTLDGSQPNSGSTPYTGPITLAPGQTLTIASINGETVTATATCGGDILEFANDTIGNGGGFPFDQHDSVDIVAVVFNGLAHLADSQTLTFATCPNLATAEFNAFATIGAGCTFDISGCDLLTSLSMPALATIGANVTFNASDCPLLAEVTLGDFIVGNGAEINFSGRSRRIAGTRNFE